VAGNFLGKLRGRSPDDPAVAEARSELKQLAAERPGLEGPIGWLDAVLPHLATSPELTIPPLSKEAAHAKLAAGTPLARGEELSLDAKLLARRWRVACEALPQDESARTLAAAVRSGKLDLRELAGAVLVGRLEHLHEQMAELDVDASLAATLLRFTLFPTLAAVSKARASLCDGVSWERGDCPTCGAWPLLGEFRGLEQTRFLRCGWCAASWKAPRLFCPYCGNRDHEQLGLLHREGEEARYRASTCHACRRYVKMLATLAELSPLRLWVADVSTLHLDLAAAEQGFHVG
jgi:FdhE protein